MARRPEAKTALACDRCRQRKSRCDGLRPRCSHCTAAGIECHYRPTATTLESDAALLSRLESVETRLQGLEEAPARDHRQHELFGGSRRRDDGFRAADRAGISASPPQFHTASALQMIHSWPRLRLCFTELGNTLEALAVADQLQEPIGAHLDLRHGPISTSLLRRCDIKEILQASAGSWDRMPPIAQLIQDSHPHLQPDHIAHNNNLEIDAVARPEDFTPLHAMGITLAMANPELRLPGSIDRYTLISVYLASVLQRQWLTWNEIHERIALSIAIAYCLLQHCARPHQALGALQSAKASLLRMRTRLNKDPYVAVLSTVYFMLESDILSEVDEFSTDTILSADLADVITVEPFKRLAISQDPGEDAPHTALDLSKYADFDDIIWLRSQMNRILHLYTPNRAYARPSQLAELVFELGATLRNWYQRLPLERQFSRDILTFHLYEPALRADSARRELALRYFACSFFLHRPVLYFFLHEEMEDTIEPPGGNSSAVDRGPWVMESCRDCIESLALIIRLCLSKNGDHAVSAPRYWPEYQLLFSAYLVLVQVRTYDALEPYLRVIGSVDELLNAIEEEFRVNLLRSMVLAESLAMLLTTRRNFDMASPGHMES